jgi:N-acetylneuraminic acid mutarotase
MNTTTKVWTEVDPLPNAEGISHMGTVIVGNKVYACGGYVGGLDGHFLASSACYVYTHGNPPGTQWSTLPSLPFIRSGGALFHSMKRNSIYFATGADVHDMPIPQREVDHYDVWELSLDNIPAGWVSRANIPYHANHVGSTTVVTSDGNEHNFVLGGQNGPKEADGNYNLVYEYNALADTWTQRANITVATGHISSSTVAYKNCGFFILGGANNNKYKTSAVYYYDIGSDNWTLVGNTSQPGNTPVCGILNDWIYCIHRRGWWRRQIG